MKAVNAVALLLIIIGGVNWGLVGFFDFNLVDTLFGAGSALARVVYAVVGLAAVYKLVVKIDALLIDLAGSVREDPAPCDGEPVRGETEIFKQRDIFSETVIMIAGSLGIRKACTFGIGRGFDILLRSLFSVLACRSFALVSAGRSSP